MSFKNREFILFGGFILSSFVFRSIAGGIRTQTGRRSVDPYFRDALKIRNQSLRDLFYFKKLLMKEKPKKVKVDETPKVKGGAKKVNCAELLVQELDRVCDQGLASMVKISWVAVEQVEDQSLYVSHVVQAIRAMVPRIKDCLQTRRKSFNQFCIKFVSTFIPKFISNLCKCKPVGRVGAEQLLLDTHSLKNVLLDLPSLVVDGQVKPVGRKAPQAFTKVVVQGMTRAEMILKVVMSPMEPPRAFVVQYMRLVQNTEGAELSILLDMKGVKTSEHSMYLELYRDSQADGGVGGGHDGGEQGGDSVLGSPLHGAQQEQSRIAKLEKVKKVRVRGRKAGALKAGTKVAVAVGCDSMETSDVGTSAMEARGVGTSAMETSGMGTSAMETRVVGTSAMETASTALGSGTGETSSVVTGAVTSFVVGAGTEVIGTVETCTEGSNEKENLDEKGYRDISRVGVRLLRFIIFYSSVSRCFATIVIIWYRKRSITVVMILKSVMYMWGLTGGRVY